MLQRIYRVNYDEILQFPEQEPETGDARLNLNVLADDAEHAVARLRDRYVGEERIVEGIEKEKFHGTVCGLRINEVREGPFINLP